jgi:hypothetical protein
MKIKVEVKIENSNGTENISPVVMEGEIPDFSEFKGPDKFREVFDKLERTALKVRNESMKQAIENYSSELSKKKVYERAGKKVNVEIEDSNGYKIEAEIGRLNIGTHKIKRGNFTVYDTGRDVFQETNPREMCRTACMDEIMLMFPIDESYRNSVEKIDRVLRRDEGEGVKSRTLADIVVREGENIQAYLIEKAQEILSANSFDKNGKPAEGTVVFTDCEATGIHELSNTDGMNSNQNTTGVEKEPPNTGLDKSGEVDCSCKAITISAPVVIPKDKVKAAIDNYNKDKPLGKQIDAGRVDEIYEDRMNVVNVSVDDVQVVKQKEKERKKGSPAKEKREWVKNTIVHISCNKMVYLLNGSSIIVALMLLTGFMLNNDIAYIGNLVFFTDGARDLQNAIMGMYGWRSYKIILDWFHLEKKCKELLSMGIKTKIAKEAVLTVLLTLLWLGKVDDTIEYLENLDTSIIKSEGKIKELIGYFEKNTKNIPCYALRKELRLKISSNSVEKANDNIVSNRQKDNGTSWSKSGSVSLSSVQVMFKNNESDNWIRRRTFGFKFTGSKLAS